MPNLETLEFRAVSTEYERAVSAATTFDGAVVDDIRLPGPGDGTRVFERRAVTLPPGIERIVEEDGYELTHDLLADPLVLPSGSVVADGALAGGVGALPYPVDPGTHPVHVTLVRYPGNTFEVVALASLVVSDATPVRWEQVAGVGVDGGTAAFTSAEGSAALGKLIDDDDRAWTALLQAGFDSLIAHDHPVTEWPIDDRLNFVLLSSGVGDGGYPVFVGLDQDGRPTRFVIDFMQLHLAWRGG